MSPEMVQLLQRVRDVPRNGTCEVAAFVTGERAGIVHSILKCCFPKVDHAAARAAEENESSEASRDASPTVRHFFMTDCWRGLIAELKTLSWNIPEIRFLLRYGACVEQGGEDEIEGESADEDGTVVREVEFVAGEVVKFQGSEIERAEIEDARNLGRLWLRLKAEELQKSVFNMYRQESEAGIILGWKEKMTMGLKQEAYEDLKGRLDAIDRKILDVFQESCKEVLRLGSRRYEAADAREALEKVLNWASGEEPSAALLEPAELEQLQAANRVLEKIAGDVPARSKWI